MNQEVVTELPRVVELRQSGSNWRCPKVSDQLPRQRAGTAANPHTRIQIRIQIQVHKQIQQLEVSEGVQPTAAPGEPELQQPAKPTY